MSEKTNRNPSPNGQWQKLQRVFTEFPSQFWILVGATFIDRLGGAMLFPFFTLYMTRKFGLSMTQVGVFFFLFAISSVVGSMIGGALTDRLGRKWMLLFGLTMSALSAVLMGITNQIEIFLLVVIVVGMLADAGGPAQQALVADLLPEDKRAEGFGILRVVFNLAVVIGPLVGGLLASQDYLLLFIADAITSSITAAIVFFALKETRPTAPKEEGEPQESMLQTFAGYGVALRDKAFVWFLGASALMVLVYIQMNTTLAVFLRDNYGVNEQGFSYILALNAAMVVLFQFPITHWVARYRPLLVMTAGTLLYAIGFAMYGFVSLYFFFLVAMVIITIGEMMVSPVGQAIVAQFAPEEMRGRYMAVFGFSWVIPFAIGPFFAGLVLDNLNPDWLWYAAGVLGIIAAAAFYLLEQRVDRARWAVVDQRISIIEQLEEGKISAQAASQMLEAVDHGTWARLVPKAETNSERRHLRVRVSDLNSGMMKVDLRLPMGLVNTVLYAGGQFSADLEESNVAHLRELLANDGLQEAPRQVENGDERMEISLE
jgi:MFS family permease